MLENRLDISFNLTGIYFTNSLSGIFVITLITTLILPISLVESTKFIPSNGLTSLVSDFYLFTNSLVIFIFGFVGCLVCGFNFAICEGSRG